jgi:Tol biopolymer transport system component
MNTTACRRSGLRIGLVMLAAAIACLAASALCAPARADSFGPISLVSAGSLGGAPVQQAEYAHDAAISGDGRYVAFDGSVAGVTGVWRRDLLTGAVQLVAGQDAELPSISEEGRYVSFTTTAQLVPEDETRGPNVWVADMQAAPGEGRYILASARTGSNQGLRYRYGANAAQEEQKYGSVAAGRSAISADGQEVAFVTTAISDLLAYPQLEREEEEEGNVPVPHTPALQVAVRDLRTRETRLVSRCFQCADSSEPVSAEAGGGTFGAVYPGSAAALGFTPPPPNGKWGLDPPPGASISADGTTVAWMGEEIGLQARMLSRETPLPLYTEPLWRRIAPGSETPTERVTGGSDPTSPACVASGEAALPVIEHQSAADPCQGPFEVEVEAGGGNGSSGIWLEGEGNFVPRLSADGYTVAFVSRALPISFGLGFGSSREGSSDLYVADMHTGLTRGQALTPLTKIAGEGVAPADPVTDFAISADGSQLAFTTRRTQFVLGSPAFVSPPAAEAGESELFEVDLADATLTRVSHGVGGQASEQSHGSKLECPEYEDVYCAQTTIGAQSPSLSSDGSLLAFSSTAANLAPGDGNAPPGGPGDGSDAFTVQRRIFAPLPTPQVISPPPATPTDPAWQIGATSVSRRDGSVLLYVTVPGPGMLRAGAGSALPVRVVRGKGAARRVRRVLVTRQVARASRFAAGGEGEVVQLVLRLGRPYAALAARAGGLWGSVHLTFASAGHATLSEPLGVTFQGRVHSAKRSRSGRVAHRRRARR